MNLKNKELKRKIIFEAETTEKVRNTNKRQIGKNQNAIYLSNILQAIEIDKNTYTYYLT